MKWATQKLWKHVFLNRILSATPQRYFEKSIVASKCSQLALVILKKTKIAQLRPLVLLQRCRHWKHAYRLF